MNKIKLIVLSLAAMVGIATVVPSYSVLAAPADRIEDGIDDAGGAGSSADLGKAIKDIVNMVLYLLGAVAVIMIVIGGVKYTTSNGDSASVTSAKNTILYAVIGLVVAIMAYAIVNFVVDAF